VARVSRIKQPPMHNCARYFFFLLSQSLLRSTACASEPVLFLHNFHLKLAAQNLFHVPGYNQEWMNGTTALLPEPSGEDDDEL